ncbi:TrfB transcriptional repressor [Pseudomonas duriflava]|uniref:TrfB transcriptional repressor n=1 Tax=Pseudomonas duriflava TaxID=459528 RepID=A0A562PJW8_9PSED|nr:TrfB-related DNA-binding protein [Pseudomonas duriflava]TWI44678.1 TrfB transcriptional repressor [Pseudomonas duriflava]
MKKLLTEQQFLEAIKGLDMSEQNLEVARQVLVHGKPQAEFVKELGLTRGAVSQTVNRVWSRSAVAKQAHLPEGYERVTVVLPKAKAYTVKKWAAQAHNALAKTTG